MLQLLLYLWCCCCSLFRRLLLPCSSIEGELALLGKGILLGYSFSFSFSWGKDKIEKVRVAIDHYLQYSSLLHSSSVYLPEAFNIAVPSNLQDACHI